MATYKKRKIKNKISSQKKSIESTQQVFDSLDVGASKTELFISKYQNYLFAGVLLLIISFGSFYLYDKFIFQPKNLEANKEIFTAQNYFDLALKSNENQDSLFMLSLDGTGGKFGFLDIIDNYAGTDAANIAFYSTGMAYYNMSKYDLAIQYLENFSSSDEILQSLASSTIGDSFIQLEQFSDGLNSYEDALSKTSNSFIRPIILQKAGDIAAELKKNKKAKKYYSEIKESFPKSSQANLIDVKIEKLN